jgi:hypothetical protein
MKQTGDLTVLIKVRASQQPPQQKQEQMIRPLLAHLAGGSHHDEEQWQEWQIMRITGGRNNLLYRASGPGGDLAIITAKR